MLDLDVPGDYLAAMTQTSPATAAYRPIHGLSQLCDEYDVVLSDIWGVVHDGVAAFAPACAALSEFRRRGGTVVLITNAPRPNGPIIKQLQHFGAPKDIYDAVVSSGDVTLTLMAAEGAKPVYHIGPERDLALMDELRKHVPLMPALVPLDKAEYVLCTGLDVDVTAPEDYETQILPPDIEALLAEMKRRGLKMICANPDIVVHVGDELIYCAGALGERYRAIGGATLYSGKPYRPIYEEALRQAAALRGGPTPLARVLAIGDAIRTDVAGAVGQGLDVLMITSGIHREEMHNAAGELDHVKIEHFLHGASHRPFAVADALRW